MSDDTIPPPPTGDRPGPHRQPLLHHPRLYPDLQPAAEAHAQRDRAVPRLLPVLRVQEHHRERGKAYSKKPGVLGPSPPLRSIVH